MATRMVPNPVDMSLGTGLDRPTEPRGTTGKHRLHPTTHLASQGMVMRIRFITLLQNLVYGDLV